MILAGGRSTRMGGGDKALLPLGDRPVIAHVIGRLAPQVSALAINANGDPGRFAAFGLPVHADPVPDHPGPLAGVLAGLAWAETLGAPFVVTVAADTPFFPTDLVARLRGAAAAAGTPIALAATPDTDRTNRHPTFGLWSVALREDLARALGAGVRKVVAWADPHGAATAMFEAEGFDPFFNLNTPADMVLAQKLMRA